MLLRPATEDDIEQVLACAPAGPPGSVPADRYRARLAAGNYRPEWTWIAEEAGQVRARACWWGPADGDHPLALDGVDVHESVPGRAALAARLLAAGHAAFRARGTPRPPRFEILLPNGWRADPAVARSLGWRRRAAILAGLTDELERLRYEWTPGAGVPGQSGRLAYRAEPDDQVFLEAFRRVAVGSLDVTTRRAVAALGAACQARTDMQAYLSMPGRRDWWRLARTLDGALAGLAIPSRSPDGPVVGYLGVVPELRGRGYIDDILAEITGFHAAAGAQRVAADTDISNLPMAAAFERAGYRNDGMRLVLSAPYG
jgi:GNAT superfamily N-acetyltransferase